MRDPRSCWPPSRRRRRCRCRARARRSSSASPFCCSRRGPRVCSSRSLAAGIMIGAVAGAVLATAAFPDAILGVQSRFAERRDHRSPRPGGDGPTAGRAGDARLPTGRHRDGHAAERARVTGCSAPNWETEMEQHRYLVELGPIGFCLVWTHEAGLLVALLRCVQASSSARDAGRRRRRPVVRGPDVLRQPDVRPRLAGPASSWAAGSSSPKWCRWSGPKVRSVRRRPRKRRKHRNACASSSPADRDADRIRQERARVRSQNDAACSTARAPSCSRISRDSAGSRRTNWAGNTMSRSRCGVISATASRYCSV